MKYICLVQVSFTVREGYIHEELNYISLHAYNSKIDGHIEFDITEFDSLSFLSRGYAKEIRLERSKWVVHK